MLQQTKKKMLFSTIISPAKVFQAPSHGSAAQAEVTGGASKRPIGEGYRCDCGFRPGLVWEVARLIFY